MTARLTIDLAALAANFHTLRAEAAGAEVACVVKADGYGLGVEAIARRLVKEGARSFFVARASEGTALRKAVGPGPVIYVLDGAVAGSEDNLAAHTSTHQAQRWRGPAALHVDTGMNRLGVSVDEAVELGASGFKPVLVMSHLSRGDLLDEVLNRTQLARFRTARAAFPDCRGSLAASSGTYLGPDYHFDMVRPGISLYGGGPREVPDPRFHAVATLNADILQLRDLKAGESAGYGTMFTASADMRLAIVGAGYADGVIRAAAGKGYGVVRGVRCPFAIITMDLIGLDVSAVAGVTIGDAAELLGCEALLDDLAQAAGSVAHECLVRLSPRARRTYIG